MTSKAGRLAYKPVGLVLGAAAGAISGIVFRQLWKQLAGETEAPHASDEDRGWTEILGAALLQGAIFAVVRAAVEHAGATGVRRVTGTWPV